MGQIIENIRAVCNEKGTTFTRLEKELGFGNGSIAKSEHISASRLYQIAKYLNVPMEYLITGEMSDADDGQLALQKELNTLLKERVMLLDSINTHYGEILKLRDRLDEVDKSLCVLDGKGVLNATQWPDGNTIPLSELRKLHANVSESEN